MLYLEKQIIMSKDELEDQGLLEVCSNCGSIHLKEYTEGKTVCNNCGTVNFTHTITEEEYKINLEMQEELQKTLRS